MNEAEYVGLYVWKVLRQQLVVSKTVLGGKPGDEDNQTKWHWQVHYAFRRTRICCEQITSIPRHGRVGRGRE